MKGREMRKKKVEELKEMLFTLEEEHFNLRVQKAMGQLQNSARLRMVRKDIARARTLLTEKSGEERKGAGKEVKK